MEVIATNFSGDSDNGSRRSVLRICVTEPSLVQSELAKLNWLHAAAQAPGDAPPQYGKRNNCDLLTISSDAHLYLPKSVRPIFMRNLEQRSNIQIIEYMKQMRPQKYLESFSEIVTSGNYTLQQT